MTYEEALDKLDKTLIGNLELKVILTKALEKQIPQKPLAVRNLRSSRIVTFRCPNCQSDFLGQNEYELDYCEYCGQALDWSDT